MPSGNVGVWSHSCQVPTKYQHGGKSKTTHNNPKPTRHDKGSGNRRVDPFAVEHEHQPTEVDPSIAEAMAFFAD